MKKLILAAVLGIETLSLFGGAAVDAMTQDATVLMTSLSARQRYPWNGKVDIDFSFTCSIPEAFAFVNFKATYKDKDGNTVEVPMKTFDQFTTAFCTNAGTYRVTWDSVADAPNLRVTNLQYTVTANMAKYMVVDLSKGTEGPWPISYYEDVPEFADVEKGKWDDYHKTTNLVLRLIQPGTFTESWSDDTTGESRKSCYAHKSTLTRPYYIGVFELTQEQYFLMTGSYGRNVAGLFTGGRRKMRPTIVAYKDFRGLGYGGTVNWPVTGSAVDTGSPLRLLRDKTGTEGFDLPTESEWEYAARSGGSANGFWADGSDAGIKTTTAFSSIKDGVVALDSLGRYRYNGGMVKTENPDGSISYAAAPQNSDETLGTAVVGSYAPNAWGLYDVHGNVCEWTLCTWTLNKGGWTAFNTTATVDDPGCVIDPFGQWSYRSVRGGGYNTEACFCSLPWRKWSEERSGHGVRLCWRFPTPAQVAQ